MKAKELKKIVMDYERELAPGSETGLLERFVMDFGYSPEGDVSDEDVKVWINAYEMMIKKDKIGDEYNINDLF